MIEINDQKIKVKKDDIIMIDPGEVHKIVKIEEKLDYIVIKTNPDLFDKYELE